MMGDLLEYFEAQSRNLDEMSASINSPLPTNFTSCIRFNGIPILPPVVYFIYLICFLVDNKSLWFFSMFILIPHFLCRFVHNSLFHTVETVKYDTHWDHRNICDKTLMLKYSGLKSNFLIFGKFDFKRGRWVRKAICEMCFLIDSRNAVFRKILTFYWKGLVTSLFRNPPAEEVA